MIAALVGASARRAKAVFLVTALCVVAGVIFSQRLTFDALPDVTPNQVLILTDATGLTPTEVELRVTRPVEMAIAGLPRLSGQRSISRYGISAVFAVFEDDAHLIEARQLIQERLSTLDLPAGVGRPTLGPITGGLGEVFQFTLSSAERTPAELLEWVDLRLAPLLKTVRGVVEVNPWGGNRRTLEVRADASRMAARGVSMGELRDAVARATGTANGAAIEAGGGQILLRGVAQPTHPGELEAAVVRADPGAQGTSLVRVGDVATVHFGALPRLGAATADGKGEVVYVMVQMLRDENSLELSQRLEALVPALRRLLPDDVTFDLVYTRGQLVRYTLQTVAKNLLEGGSLVIAVLLLMLGSLRAGLLVALAIPLSMVFASVGMVLFGIPGSLMSLGAIDFGLLVDGAVVMVEHIFHAVDRKRARGEAITPESLSREAGPLAQEVARPVFFSVAIILLVYVPILTLTGVDGKTFRPMALTVIFALLGSLLLTLTFVPAAARLWLRPRDIPVRPPPLVRVIDRVYPPLLAFVAARPRRTALVALAALLSGAWVYRDLGSEFVPQLDEGDLVIQTTRRPDISIDQSVRQATHLEALLLANIPEVRGVASRIGSPAVATDIMGLDQADVFVRLAPREEWRAGLSKTALIDEMSALLEEADPGAELAFTQPIQMRFNEMLGGEVTDIAVSIFGDELSELRALAERAAASIEKIPGAVDVRVLAPPDVMLLEVKPRPIDAARLGFSATDILDSVVALRAGLEAGVTYDGPLQIPIRLHLGRVDDAFRLADLPLPVPAGGWVTLSQVADLEWVKTPSLVSHESGQRRLVVGFNVRGADLGAVGHEVETRLSRDLALPVGYRLSIGGQVETLRAAQTRLSLVVPLVVLLILGVLVWTFSAWRPALLILTHVPFASVGGIFALAWRDMPVSISAAIGFIALSGIAVLNGVVLMTQVLANEAAGVSAREAALRAARTRARPVLITALVAALGFVPMMLATGIGSEVQRPLATVVVGGLATSTALTLFLLPALYGFIPRRFGRAFPSASPPSTSAG